MTPFEKNKTDSIDNLNSLISRVTVTGEKFDTVYTSEDNIDNMLENNVDVKSGSSVTLNNTVEDGKFDWELIGNCEQDTNIITYTCEGTETGTYDFTYNEVTYYFTMPTVSVGDVLYFNTDTLKLYKGETEITTASTGTESTTITMVATPNPDYLRDIRVVTGDNSVVVNNSNFLQYTLDDLKSINSSGTWNDNVYTLNDVTFTVNNDLSITVNGTANSLAILILNNSLRLTSATEYILSGCPSGGNTSTYSLRLYSGSSYETDSGTGKTFTYSSQNLVRLNIFNGTQISNLTFYPMIRLSTLEDNTYIPHQSQTLPIHLGTKYLAGIGDYADTIEGTKDNWKIVRNVGKIVFDGSESNWSITNTGTANFFYRYRYLDFLANGRYLSNYFSLAVIDSSSTKTGIYIVSNNGELRIRFGTEMSLTDFKAWLSEHNVILYYILETPTEETITDTTLIADLNSLYDATGYDGQTNIIIVPDTGNATPSLKVTGFVTEKEV